MSNFIIFCQSITFTSSFLERVSNWFSNKQCINSDYLEKNEPIWVFKRFVSLTVGTFFLFVYSQYAKFICFTSTQTRSSFALFSRHISVLLTYFYHYPWSNSMPAWVGRLRGNKNLNGITRENPVLDLINTAASFLRFIINFNSVSEGI